MDDLGLRVWFYPHTPNNGCYAWVRMMGKCNGTKTVILGLLETRPKTLTELSRELGLAPSTVSQHLKELVWMGAARRIENEHVKKWKYYQKVSDITRSSRQGGVMVYSIKVPTIAIKSLNYGWAL